MQNENYELLRRGYEAFMAGDMDTLKNEIFASDIVWHTPGNNPTSGDRNGADSVLELFGKYFELTDGTFRVEVHDLLASDDHAVVLGKVYGQRKGLSIPEDYVQVSHLKEGRVSESWIVSVDQQGTDDFFNA
jgi:ketosteroid isomerase-like protein